MRDICYWLCVFGTVFVIFGHNEGDANPRLRRLASSKISARTLTPRALSRVTVIFRASGRDRRVVEGLGIFFVGLPNIGKLERIQGRKARSLSLTIIGARPPPK